MKIIDIMEAVNIGVEQVLFEQWKHEGHMDGWNSRECSFVVDGKRYILELKTEQEVHHD